MGCSHSNLESIDYGTYIAYVCSDCKALVGGSAKGKGVEV